MKIRINPAGKLRRLNRLKARCKITSSGCWEWQGSRTPEGYGRKVAFGRICTTHRLAALFSGQRVAGKLVCHRCDNPPCINPAHLFVGTQRDNITDCVSKGRRNTPKGESHCCARLTTAQVRQILLRADEVNKLLAAEFGISPSTVCDIVKRRTWKSVKPIRKVKL